MLGTKGFTIGRGDLVKVRTGAIAVVDDVEEDTCHLTDGTSYTSSELEVLSYARGKNTDDDVWSTK